MKSGLTGNASTTIPFHLEKAAGIKLTAINLMGQTVRTLAAGQIAAGDHMMAWDGRNEAGEIAPSGT
ncbi:MAG: FlgD immunoglobulin-like domain containing protein [bacterium]